MEGRDDGADIELDDVNEPEDMAELSPVCSRSDNRRAGNESAKALEIVCEGVVVWQRNTEG